MKQDQIDRTRQAAERLTGKVKEKVLALCSIAEMAYLVGDAKKAFAKIQEAHDIIETQGA